MAMNAVSTGMIAVATCVNMLTMPVASGQTP